LRYPQSYDNRNFEQFLLKMAGLSGERSRTFRDAEALSGVDKFEGRPPIQPAASDKSRIGAKKTPATPALSPTLLALAFGRSWALGSAEC